MQQFVDAILALWQDSGLARLLNFSGGGWKNLIMIAVACVLLFLAIKKKFEPLLLLPIAFGMLLVNLPLGGIMDPQRNSMVEFTAEELVQYVDGTYEQVYPVYENQQTFDATYAQALNLQDYTTAAGDVIKVVSVEGKIYKATVDFAGNITVTVPMWQHFEQGGLLWYLYQGVKFGIYPPLIFLGIGVMTDFGPLLSNPKSFLLGAAAQFGIFATYFGARCLNLLPFAEAWGINFTQRQAASIGIIGGADGPTAIFLTSKLAPELLGAIAVAAYSYMALVPIIQPPIMRALTTKKERSVVMTQLREVSKTEKILFPIIVTVICVLLLPSAAPLIGMLMLGNLMRESGVVDRISKTAQNELMNIVTIFLGVTVGATANAYNFLKPTTLLIIALGLIAFCMGTAGGVLLGKVMYYATGGKVNPLIGSAGVSAVPMAARVSQKVGQEENPSNFLLMHAMGPNVAGVIGSAVAAGVLLSLFG
ncbi:MAG: sodium ion-translocating decarboxylase subunit beta [Clostridia bacterium]|nr:sodium ion-translocating decarboxylase subunit beta [Clostridia bacterium]